MRSAVAALWFLAGLATSARAAEAKLERVEMVNGIEILRVPDPAKPDFLRLVAKPAGDGPFPAVVVNHGVGSSAKFVYDCLAFPAAGFVAVACDLRHKEIPRDDLKSLKWEPGTGPGASAENIRRDRESIEVLRRLPFVDARRLAMFGHSAGGFLTVGFLALGNQDRAIRVAAATAAGVFPRDPEHLRNPRNPGQVRAFPQINQIKAMAAPLDALKNIGVPLLSIHGRLDPICPLEADETLRDELQRLGKEHALLIQDQAGHNDTKSPANFEAVVRYFRQVLDSPPIHPTSSPP
jgi:dienelactone hydrolase